MNKKELILWNQTKCTITEEADLDIPENFYFQWEDALKAMQAYSDQVIAERMPSEEEAGKQCCDLLIERKGLINISVAYAFGFKDCWKWLKSLQQENQTEEG